MKGEKVNGVPVKFPYEPYEAQSLSIKTLINGFENGKSSLIESPTGTGKSLSIICAALAYLEHERRRLCIEPSKKSQTNDLENLINADEENKQKLPKIYICSRTHKQLDQLVEQLRKTEYKPTMAILGSRHQYCINPSMENAADLNSACQDAVKNKKCQWRNGVGRLKKRIDDIHDIEELKTAGTKCHGCPYFASREMADDADVVFAPYNYMIEPSIRKSINIRLTNAIVIIDEAHNVEDTCRAAGSVDLDSKTLEAWLSELYTVNTKTKLLESITDEFVVLMDFIKKFKTGSVAIECTEKNYDFSYKIFKGISIINELNKMGIDQLYYRRIEAAIQKIFVEDEDTKSLVSQHLSTGIKDVAYIVQMCLSTQYSKDYVLCYKKSNRDKGFSFCFWLLNPAPIFKQITDDAKSVALLSGTLTPFSSFTSELAHNFDNQIIAPHILKSDQVMIANIQKGHLGKDIVGTYAISESFDYLDQVCKMIEKIGHSVKEHGGTLVFLPSYAFLKKLAERMKTPVLLEPQTGGNEAFEKTLKKYKKELKDIKKPSILFCVCRGKAAEGIDFKDESARAVIVVGIPYPSFKDPQIIAKKEYNNSNKSSYNGNAWYSTQAFRAVNQALGRVVRHPKDWGVVYLLESRYKQSYSRKQLPEWVRNNIKDYDSFSDSEKDLAQFLKGKKENSAPVTLDKFFVLKK